MTEPAAEEGIRAFWGWWREREEALSTLVPAGMTPETIAEVRERVAAVHPELEWEFGPGDDGRRCLAVTGAGDPALRRIAEAWRQAAPASARFEFHATRPPAPRAWLETSVLQLGPHEQFALGAFRVVAEADADRRVLHLEVFHPRLAAVAEQVAQQLTLVVLDNTLGEDAFERWIGGVALVGAEPAGATDLTGLRDRVAGLPAQWPPDEVRWAVARGTLPDGREALYTVATTLKRWDHPGLDTWCTVALPIVDRGDGWGADPGAFDRLRAVEDALVAELGADAAHVGRRIGLGAYTVLLYVAPDTVVRVERWVRVHAPEAEVAATADPGWSERPQV